MLDCVVSLLQIHKCNKQRPSLQDGSVNEVPQGKKMVDRRMKLGRKCTKPQKYEILEIGQGKTQILQPWIARSGQAKQTNILHQGGQI